MNQLKRAKKQMGIVSLKEKGKVGGPWFWALPKHAPAKKPNDHYARRLRNLSKMIGYRLQPTAKHRMTKRCIPKRLALTY
jgi:hypothetical protein